MNTTNQEFSSRDEMIEHLLKSNQNRLRDILTLTPEVISWLDVMAEREALSYSSLDDDQLVTAFKGL